MTWVAVGKRLFEFTKEDYKATKTQWTVDVWAVVGTPTKTEVATSF